MPYTAQDAQRFQKIVQTNVCACGTKIDEHAKAGMDGYDPASMHARPAGCCVLTDTEIPHFFGPPRQAAA